MSLRMPALDATTVANFFDELGVKIDVCKAQQRKLDMYLASGMNIVRDYICPDENGISDIFKDLLSSRGPHGQGRVFLDIFLEQLGLSSMIVDAESETIREHYTSSGRKIDLLLTFSGKGVGIENKPFAADQAKQVEDYNEYLATKFRQGYVLYYLTPAGTTPSENSISREKRNSLEASNTLRYISYQRDVREWLEACFTQCKADKVRWFLRDLIEFIDERMADDGYQENGV
jgi:hypothetical protein